MYGYELVQEIRSRTGEVMSVGEGVIYPLVHALEQGGAVKSNFFNSLLDVCARKWALPL
jgi:PadR family transcriptional regulator PadR